MDRISGDTLMALTQSLVFGLAPSLSRPNESGDQVLSRPRGPTHGTDITYEQANHPGDLTARGW